MKPYSLWDAARWAIVTLVGAWLVSILVAVLIARAALCR